MDIYGRPLAKCISQKVHDEVASDFKKGKWQTPYNHWIAAGMTVDYINVKIAELTNQPKPKSVGESDMTGRQLPNCISKETANTVYTQAPKQPALPYNHWIAAGMTVDMLNAKHAELEAKKSVIPPVILPPENVVTTPSNLIHTTPKGIGTLQAMVPSARPQVDDIVDLLFKSRISKPAFNVLFGGFGENPDYLKSIMNVLNSQGRQAHFLYYLMNGPSQRRWNSTPVRSFEVLVEPKAFRHAILTNAETQQKIITRARTINDLCNHNTSLGGVNRVTLMLEDNLDDESFQHLFNMVRPIFNSNIQIVRNPCTGAYPGNEGGVPSGCFYESHNTENQNFSNGVSTNDGKTFKFGKESVHYKEQISLSKLSKARNVASKQNNWFFLWNAKYQGLISDATPDPFSRIYSVPTDAEKVILHNFLVG